MSWRRLVNLPVVFEKSGIHYMTFFRLWCALNSSSTSTGTCRRKSKFFHKTLWFIGEKQKEKKEKLFNSWFYETNRLSFKAFCKVIGCKRREKLCKKRRQWYERKKYGRLESEFIKDATKNASQEVKVDTGKCHLHENEREFSVKTCHECALTMKPVRKSEF